LDGKRESPANRGITY